MATLRQVYKKMKKLIDAGHGDLRFGQFEHYSGDFVELADVRVTKNGGYYERPDRPKKTEDVVQVYPLLGE